MTRRKLRNRYALTLKVQ